MDRWREVGAPSRRCSLTLLSQKDADTAMPVGAGLQHICQHGSVSSGLDGTHKPAWYELVVAARQQAAQQWSDESLRRDEHQPIQSQSRRDASVSWTAVNAQPQPWGNPRAAPHDITTAGTKWFQRMPVSGCVRCCCMDTVGE